MREGEYADTLHVYTLNTKIRPNGERGRPVQNPNEREGWHHLVGVMDRIPVNEGRNTEIMNDVNENKEERRKKISVYPGHLLTRCRVSSS